MESVLLDAAGRHRSPATMPGFHRDGIEGIRLRALIVILWRAGLRISEALALAESDLDRVRGGILVRSGKGGRRREVGMDRWGWEQLQPWLEARTAMPVGALLCVIHRPTIGRPWAASSAREELRAATARTGVRRRFARISFATPTRSRCRARESRSL